jgi:uncharacterized protein (TIGR03083 family)
VTDDRELQGLDPYDLMAIEGDRLHRHFATLSDADWRQPSRCAGWSVRDVLGHLAASEAYNRASLEGTVAALLADWGAKGATDLESANALGIREQADVPTPELVERWYREASANREGFRARDGRDVDTSVGAYPARWQAFHLAFELAVHADDVFAPVTPDEQRDRFQWEARHARFALAETKPEAVIDAAGGRTRVRLGDVDVELGDEEFVEAAAARLGRDSDLDDRARAALSVTP